MALSNPWYIGANARHLPPTIRLLSYSATEGKEGVLAEGHLAVVDLDTPGGAINVLPGGYAVLARHLGGEFESYVGKISIQETVTVNPTTSGGPRTDLVILRVEDPYVTGAGTWAEPADLLNGPYAYVRVIEGVPANTNSVRALSGNWSAITLARITRPSSTGIVSQSHITDLRSLAKIGGERIIVIDDPPVDPPPIAQQYWTESTPCEDGDTHLKTQTTFHNFPAAASWQVPVPTWAAGFDLNAALNPQSTGAHWGEARLVINNGAITNDACGIIPAVFDVNWGGSVVDPLRSIYLVGGTGALQTAHRGKVVNMRLQFRSRDSSEPGNLQANQGTRCNIWINFKRTPVFDP